MSSHPLDFAPDDLDRPIHTFTIIHKAYRPEYAERVPYNVVVVELEEGPLFHSNLVGCRNEDIRVGMPVELVFEKSAEGPTLPLFRPRTDPSPAKELT